MKFSLWTDYGALNSKPVFDAFANSLGSNGHDVVYNDLNSDVDVIWSVLFNGRMSRNKTIWENEKPTIVLEVGGINRGVTWKVGLNGINRDAYFGEQDNDRTRADHLGLVCKPWRSDGDFILVCGQHDKSLQWQNMPRMSNWFLETYDEIRKHTDRPIVFRPHPRCRLEHIERGLKNVHRQEPRHVNGTYDSFDMGFDDIHCTISYSSNPGIHSVIEGVPAFVSTHSLAYDVANDIDFLHDIENPLMPDRQQWLNDYAWTEFTVEEISQGIPLKHLTSLL
ncbi:hypothetical protein OAE10_00675 [bacterium]|nr:hypothetical protein [bacterium]